MTVLGRRVVAATLVLPLLAGLFSGGHSHDGSETDLAAHEHQGGALLLASVEDCGDASHLHSSEPRHHEACPACLTAAARLGAPWRTPDVVPVRPTSLRAAAGATPAASSGSLPSDAGRAPPRA